MGQALEEIVRQYQRRVYAVIYRMTGAHADVDDLCQETFLQVFRSLPRFRPGSNFDALVYRIAMNVSVDYLRRRSRERSARPAPPPASASPDREAQEAVRRALDRLPPEQRQVVVLRMFEGLSHEKIAEVLDAPAATVRWRLFAARKKLEELLGGRV